MAFERDQLTHMLRTGVCEVTFTKVDGSVRVMPCTLDPAIVPPAPAPRVLAEGETARVKKANPDTISVWCTDKQEWRSFRVANVTSVRTTQVTA